MRALRALTSEFQIPFKFWPSVLPLVQSILNNTPLARLGRRCHLTAFTGLPADTPLRSIKTEVRGRAEMLDIDDVHARQVVKLDELTQAMENMHREIKESSSKAREARVNKHNARTHVRKCNFDVGDFVLPSSSDKAMTRKLSFRWRGPYRVTKVLSDFFFEIEDLRSAKKYTVHGTRIKFSRNKDFEVTTDFIEHLAFQDGEYCVIEQLQDLRIYEGYTQVLVKWRGFEDEDPEWESLDVMREDIPGLVDEFLDDMKNNGNARQKRIAKHC